MPNTRHASMNAVAETPLALLPSWFSRIRGDGTALVALDGPHGGATRVGSVSVLPVYGVIEHRSDWLMKMFGEGTSVSGLREALRAELADPTVSAVILDFDSPGGSVAGITEFAAELRGARGGPKPIVAQVNTLCASAAAWLAFQCDEVICTPSGHVGSIGIYSIHQDVSRLLDEMGITMTIVAAGPYKTEGNEFEPLSDVARAEIQSRVDATYATLVADVAAGRRVAASDVEANFGGGRVFTAKKALAVGMVDRIATLAQTVQRFSRPTGAGRRMSSASLLTVELEASAIGRHKTATSDESWDGPGNEARLPSPMPIAKARSAYAWLDEDRVEDGEIVKDACRFIHHEVSADGDPGAANLKACSSGIGILNGGRGGTTIPEADRAGVHRHLAGHLTDADMEAPPYTGQAPFNERIAALAAEATELTEHASERARLRAKEGRPAFSTATERSLRTIRGAIDELLAPDDPAPPPATTDPVEPAPSVSTPPSPATPTPTRFRSRADWLRYLEGTTHR
jgi:signal peptide peptidase SppA